MQGRSLRETEIRARASNSKGPLEKGLPVAATRPTKGDMARELAAVALAAAAALSCGGAAAEEECRTISRSICERAVECVVPNDSVDECTDQVSVFANCDRAEAVTSAYERCLTELRTMSCEALFPDGTEGVTPPACRGVIILDFD